MNEIIPKGLSGKSLFDFLVKNENLIFHAKKSEIKRGDEIYYSPMYINEKGALVSKAEVVETQIDPSKIQVVTVINTTNWLDSHGDVHIPGIWKKSLSDNKGTGFYLLDNHNRGFKDVIAEGCQGKAQQMTWKELGLAIPGTTEALVFTGIIEKDRNEYMFDQYRKAYVKKHSVGMRYVRMVTCINDADYPVQKENWDKYIEMVANKQDAIDEGYFWAILEAKVIEGSAVLFASNTMTPTQQVSDIEDDSTDNEPPKSTHEQPAEKSLLEMIKETQFINI